MTTDDRYTDERLNEDLTSGWPGDRNAAGFLLQLDTPARRARAAKEARILINLHGFRYSEAVWHAVRSLEDAIRGGMEDAELHGERICREDLERQKAERDARLFAPRSGFTYGR